MLFYGVYVLTLWETDVENAHVWDKGCVSVSYWIGVNKDNR